MEEAFLEVCEVAAGALERREFSLNSRSPRQDRLAGVDVRIGEPRFRGSDEPVWHQCSMLAGKLADDARVGRPGDFHGFCGKLLRIREVERGSEGRHFPDLIRSEDLGDLDDGGAAGCEIGDGDGAVASAKVDAEAELKTHFLKRVGKWKGAAARWP